MNEIKYMLYYKVGRYVHYQDITYEQKQNVLRSFVYIKQKVFPNGQLDKLKAQLVADGLESARQASVRHRILRHRFPTSSFCYLI